MKNKYIALRLLVIRDKNHVDFKSKIAATIFRWAKDDSLTLSEFGLLSKKAINYTKPLNERYA